jgi:hypothetical protein
MSPHSPNAVAIRWIRTVSSGLYQRFFANNLEKHKNEYTFAYGWSGDNLFTMDTPDFSMKEKDGNLTLHRSFQGLSTIAILIILGVLVIAIIVLLLVLSASKRKKKKKKRKKKSAKQA